LQKAPNQRNADKSPRQRKLQRGGFFLAHELVSAVSAAI
jgi:hypothetical protein